MQSSDKFWWQQIFNQWINYPLILVLVTFRRPHSCNIVVNSKYSNALHSTGRGRNWPTYKLYTGTLSWYIKWTERWMIGVCFC